MLQHEVFRSETRVFAVEIEGIEPRFAQSIHFVLEVHHEVVVRHHNARIYSFTRFSPPTVRTPAELMHFEVDVSAIVQHRLEQQAPQSGHQPIVHHLHQRGLVVDVPLLHFLQRELERGQTSLRGAPIHKTRTNRRVFLSDEVELFVSGDIFERVLENHDVRIEEQAIHAHVEHFLHCDQFEGGELIEGVTVVQTGGITSRLIV